MGRLFLTLLMLAMGWSARPYAAEPEWPQFKRDAQRSGNAPDEVLSFPLQRISAVQFPSPIYASPAVVWQHRFLSRACPSPSPAYGRLYYAPNGEGVVYCFEPEVK